MAAQEQQSKESAAPIGQWLPAVALAWFVPGGGHLLLKKQVENQLKEMLDNDFLGLDPEQMDDPPFALQQMVIDGLFVGVQAELERLT